MSVLCAERIVATANSSGEVKSSSQYTWGNACASLRFIRRARRTKAVRVSSDQRLGNLGVDAFAVGLDLPDTFATLTYDRVLIS
ncbi:hypothetical protein NJB1907Z4_C03070 [Mycobacterium pseudoshottsii]|uniref:Uncharacterized protein n=1 Tax=Mycobacterium pseudoshottsii TaxID=265949 RepID=A0A9N7LN22_9MYCO|nr:hypothetical protein NJB1907Z4_C03070 [Mycobacterium pseudoshottsii]